MLEYYYITNSPDCALICEKLGIDRIFVDTEYIGKGERQGKLDTVKNHHTAEDVKNIKKAITKSKILVRVNPIYEGSKKEIDDVIEAGADYVMLPMWKTVEDVQTFIDFVGGRAKTMLLLETDEARLCVDKILELDGIDEIHIGLNDLHLSQKKTFMFELLVDGTVDEIVAKLKAKNMKFGVGGVGRINGHNVLPAENILTEHYRLGSSMCILSRKFCDWKKHSLEEFEQIATQGITDNRNFEKLLENQTDDYFNKMHKETELKVNQIKSDLQK